MTQETIDVLLEVDNFVRECQEATTVSNIPSDLLDRCTAYRDRMTLLRDKVNGWLGEQPGFAPIPEFDPIPS